MASLYVCVASPQENKYYWWIHCLLLTHSIHMLRHQTNLKSLTHGFDTLCSYAAEPIEDKNIMASIFCHNFKPNSGFFIMHLNSSLLSKHDELISLTNKGYGIIYQMKELCANCINIRWLIDIICSHFSYYFIRHKKKTLEPNRWNGMSVCI